MPDRQYQIVTTMTTTSASMGRRQYDADTNDMMRLANATASRRRREADGQCHSVTTMIAHQSTPTRRRCRPHDANGHGVTTMTAGEAKGR